MWSALYGGASFGLEKVIPLPAVEGPFDPLAEGATSTKFGLPRRAPSVIRSSMTLYGQYCPVARAAEILADRWTVLIIRELLADIHHFNELERGLPRMSRTLLAERLRRLQRAGVLDRARTATE